MSVQVFLEVFISFCKSVQVCASLCKSMQVFKESVCKFLQFCAIVEINATIVEVYKKSFFCFYQLFSVNLV